MYSALKHGSLVVGRKNGVEVEIYPMFILLGMSESNVDAIFLSTSIVLLFMLGCLLTHARQAL